ncbi:hypothetical protein, partial [Klebsiella pneumoniae]|uniref:hypothetical protein n=1 Tax=Klebsiella pneumoniae TaxID=573 RepID=UPI001954E3B4
TYSGLGSKITKPHSAKGRDDRRRNQTVELFLRKRIPRSENLARSMETITAGYECSAISQPALGYPQYASK